MKVEVYFIDTGETVVYSLEAFREQYNNDFIDSSSTYINFIEV
jgi:hypothetical protein